MTRRVISSELQRQMQTDQDRKLKYIWRIKPLHIII